LCTKLSGTFNDKMQISQVKSISSKNIDKYNKKGIICTIKTSKNRTIESNVVVLWFILAFTPQNKNSTANTGQKSTIIHYLLLVKN